MKRQKHILTLALLAVGLVLAGCKVGLLNVGLGDKVDILPPGISIVPTNGVQNGAYVRGTVTVHGKASDDVSVESVTWMFADEATGDPSPVGTAHVEADKTWWFDLDTQNPAWGASLTSDGEKTFVITVTDGSGKSTETRMLLIFDNAAPSFTFSNPPNGGTVYSSVTVRGVNSDNTSLIKVQVRIGYPATPDPDAGFVDLVGSKYDWARTFDTADYANDTKSKDNHDGTFTLPVFVRVIDYAGNVSTNEPSATDLERPDLYPAALVALYGVDAVTFVDNQPPYSLVIDPDQDKPSATIQTPQNGTNVGGAVVASGTCFDESPGIGKVEIRIMALEDDDTPIGYVTPDGDIPAPDEWIETTVSGGSYWQVTLNGNDRLYDVTAAGGAYEGLGDHNGRLRIDIMPTDLGGYPGLVKTVSIRLDQTVPRVSDQKIVLEDNGGAIKDAWDYLYVRGDIRLTARAADNQAVTSIKLSLGGSFEELIPGATTPFSNPPDEYGYLIDKAIDTVNSVQIPSAIRTAKNGQLSMIVRVEDDASPSHYVNIWSIVLNLDNLYPTGSYTGTVLNGHDPADLHGDIGDSPSHSQVMGTSADGGTVGGVDKVEVYLVNVEDDKIINLADGSLVARESMLFGEIPTSADYTTNAACKLVIDWTKVGAVDHMQLTQNGSNVDWWAQLDSDANHFPDGDVEINYVVWDKAGNAVHGMEPGFIRNNVPVISSVTVGTDLNDDGDANDSGEKTPYNPASPITARNDLLYLKINTTTVGMNTPFTYSIKNTTPGDVTEYSDASGVATINIAGKFGGDGNGKVFMVKITDDVGIVVQQTVTVNIDNIDGEDPTISVSPIGAPADLLDWTSTPVAGHIESIGDSTYDNGTPDADVSGTVMVRGTAHDNVRIDAITLSIDGGAPFQVAHWVGAGLSADVPEFHLTTETLADAGHDVAWDYKWNTAGIATVAKNDVALAFVATDHSANNSINVLRTRQYDVVPYMTQVDTSITSLLSKDFARSAAGAYPVRAGETVTIKGYNLKPAVTGIGAGASDVRVVSAANRDSVVKNAGAGSRGLVYAGVGGAYTSFTADISTVAADASIKSGFLVVWVNGVPSLNARTRTNNAETNFVSTTGTDERWLTVWNLTRLKDSVAGAQYGLYPSMAMSGDTPVFAYVNNSAGYGQAKFWNGAAEKSIYNNWDLFTFSAVSVNASGNHGVLFDINVVNGNYGDYNPGNSGGVLTSFFYDVPAHTWSSCYDFKAYHVWLDNLVDTRHRHVGTVDRSGGYNWSAGTQTLIVTTGAGGPSTLTLDANCANLAAIVTHINTKLALAPNHANYLEAYDAGSGHVGMRIKGNPTGGGDQSYTLGAGTAMATLGFTAGTYSGVAAILDRYRFPDLVLRGTTAVSTAYYSAYDALENKVIARAYKVGNDNGQVVGNAIFSGGSVLYTNIGQYAGSGAFPLYNGSGSTGSTTTATNSRFYNNLASNPAGRSPDGAYTLATGAGPWTAAAATSGGVMLVVWYDTGANQLKYAYNTTPSAAGAGSFTGTKVIDTFCGGDYVDMVVDAADQVHIAYHDSFSGDLKYVFFPAYDGVAQGPFTVDSYLTVGNKAGIAVSGAGVPSITYKGMGNTAKVATLAGAPGNGVDGSGKFTGTWEVQVLPQSIVDTDTNRFCMGVDSTPLPVVGYTNSGTGIEYLRRLADLP
jgi:hypothetical protein